MAVRELTETPPWLEQLTGNRYRFHAAAGGTWRVHDFALLPDPASGEHKRRVYSKLGVRTATYRAFVPPNGPKRVYQFGKSESRSADVMHLERQLRESQYLGTRRVPDRQPW